MVAVLDVLNTKLVAGILGLLGFVFIVCHLVIFLYIFIYIYYMAYIYIYNIPTNIPKDDRFGLE